MSFEEEKEIYDKYPVLNKLSSEEKRIFLTRTLMRELGLSSYLELGKLIAKTLYLEHPKIQDNFWWIIYNIAKQYTKKVPYIDARNELAAKFAAKIVSLKW